MAMTIEQFAQSVKAKYPQYKNIPDAELTTKMLEKYPQYKRVFNDTQPATDGNVTSGSTGQGVSHTQSPFDFSNPAMGMNVLGQVGEAAKGAIKGLGSTIAGIGNIGNKLLGPLVGAHDVQGTSDYVKQLQSTLFKGNNTAQNVGRGAEQLAEFFVPGGAINRAGKAVEGAVGASKLLGSLPNIAGGISLLGKAGLESASMAGVTAAQGGSKKEIAQNAALGAGGQLIGSTLGNFSQLISPAVQSAAEKSMARALGATTKADKVLTAKVVPGLLERGVTGMSRKSLLNSFANSVKNAGDTMSKVLDTIPADSPVNLSSVSAKLDEAKNAYLVAGQGGKMVVADPQAVAHIEGFQKILNQIGTDNAPFASVRKLRQIWDNGVAQAGGYAGKTLSEGSLIEAQKTAANALRTELVKGRPDLEKVNAEFNFWSNAQKVLKDTVERTSSQGTPLTKQLTRVAGVGVGGLNGIALAAIGEIASSTGWRTVTAVMRSRLADSLAKGRPQDVISLITRILGSQRLK